MKTGARPLGIFLSELRASARIAAAILLLGLCVFGASFSVRAQEAANPLAGDPKAIQEGGSQFRIDCALCHGLAAQGGPRAPDLTRGVWNHGGSDAAIIRTIRSGVPGTLMPANDLSDAETWEIIAYLRSLNAGESKPVHGDLKAGKQIFFGSANCATCHMVNGKGGRLGPDLSRIGGARSPNFIAEKLRNPNGSLAVSGADQYREWPLEYEAVTVVTKNNQTLSGVLRDEDTFSIQFMDLSEKLHSYWKKDLVKVTHEHRTVMPAFGEDVLSAGELHDLLAYLDSLRPHEGESHP